MTRKQIRENVRRMLRQVNVSPFTDPDIDDAIEDAIDDFSNRVPFAVATQRTHGVRNQREYIMPLDVLEVMDVWYKPQIGTVLSADIADDATSIAVLDATDFATTGTLYIGSEQITYTGKTGNTFTGCTRGANSTTASAYTAGTAVTESAKKFKKLVPKSVVSFADQSSTFMDDTGTPTGYYTHPGILGFDKTPDKGGYMNILMRTYIRPPAMTKDTQTVESLLSTFVRSIAKCTASKLAYRMAQDEASKTQGMLWLQEYLGDVQMMKQKRDAYQHGVEAGFEPRMYRDGVV